MATHSSILTWRIPVDRGACWATVHGGHKESDMTEQLSHAESYDIKKTYIDGERLKTQNGQDTNAVQTLMQIQLNSNKNNKN